MLFSTYGPVLDIVALKNMKMRGQAHIVFRDTQASSQAMRALQDFEFFGKRMVRGRTLCRLVELILTQSASEYRTVEEDQMSSHA